MATFNPVFILDVFWKATCVAAKPAATSMTGITKASSFTYRMFMVEHRMTFGLFRLCLEKYS